MLKKQFLRDVKNTVAPTHLVVAVKLPTGAVEITTNDSGLKEKFEYITEAYDDDFKLKIRPQVSIIGYMLI